MIEELLNDMSTAIVMLDETNPAEALKELAQQLGVLAVEARATHPQLAESAAYVQGQASARTPAEALVLIREFLSKAQHHLKKPAEVSLPNAQQKPKSASPEMADEIDPQFLVEFIEKHTSMMEELEGHLLDYNFAKDNLEAEGLEESKKELATYVNGYIHNVKGDAGSIGLLGVERVCHHVEDTLADIPADQLVEEILALRVWCSECIKALAAKTEPKEPSIAFNEKFDKLVARKHALAGIASAPAVEVLSAEANLDLLAELMSADELPEARAVTTAPVAASQTADKPKQSAPAAKGPVGETYQLTGEMDIFHEFAVEAEDHLAIVESTILECAGKYNQDAIGSIFRSIHSIKGSSSYFGLKEITETSHVLENLLDEVREGKREFEQPLTELVLKYLDLQRGLLAQARSSLEKGVPLVRGEASAQYLHALVVYQNGEAAQPQLPLAPVVATPAAASAPRTEAKVAPVIAPSHPAGTDSESTAKGEQLEVKTYIKVDTKRLDQLIDAIGEMGIYCSMLIQRCRGAFAGDESLMKVTHQVEKVTRDVQNIGMSMRLIPIRGLFQKMSRLVWDLSRKMGKDIKFSMEGEDTELDRTIIDKLADPLMHMVRNSLDHGIEPPEDRRAAGKPPVGRVRLSAYHAGGSIHIRIEDDGRGMDPQKLVKKAIEKGVLPPDAKLTPAEAYQLIFAAGFSMAAVVTDVSGRGVGMDVVKRNIESMRGRVNIDSQLGRGTIFTIELPLTLALMDGIEVLVGEEHFIIPMLSVIEFIRPGARTMTRTFDRGETFFFRGQYLSVFRLGDLFGIEARCKEPTEANFVILEAHGERYALMVDDIVGSYATVIKSLGSMFEQNKGLAGCAIMAQGDVAVILDVWSLLVLAREHYRHATRHGSAIEVESSAKTEGPPPDEGRETHVH